MIDINLLLDKHNPKAITKSIALNFVQLRVSKKIKQEELAKKSGVSLSSLRRFEQTHDISLKNLVLLSIALDETTAFTELFIQKSSNNLDDFINKKEIQNKKRVRK